MLNKYPANATATEQDRDAVATACSRLGSEWGTRPALTTQKISGDNPGYGMTLALAATRDAVHACRHTAPSATRDTTRARHHMASPAHTPAVRIRSLSHNALALHEITLPRHVDSSSSGKVILLFAYRSGTIVTVEDGALRVYSAAQPDCMNNVDLSSLTHLILGRHQHRARKNRKGSQRHRKHRYRLGRRKALLTYTPRNARLLHAALRNTFELVNGLRSGKPYIADFSGGRTGAGQRAQGGGRAAGSSNEPNHSDTRTPQPICPVAARGVIREGDGGRKLPIAINHQTAAAWTLPYPCLSIF